MEFLVRITARSGRRPDPEEGRLLIEAERTRAVELAERGTLQRLWRVPGRSANVGIWEAEDVTSLHATLASLPLAPWCEVDVSPLAWHPSDPGARPASLTSEDQVR